MELRQLQAFIAVVQEGSFTRAAERLGLAQPSLSARIQGLEAVLGVQLLQRDKRPVQLTRSGIVLLDYASRALALLEAGQASLQALQQGLAGRVMLGAPFSICTYLLPDVVRDFHATYPEIELSIEAGTSEVLIDRLTDGVINLTFAAAFPNLVRRTRTLLRLHDEMVAAAPATHPLVGPRPIPLDRVFQGQTLHIHWGQAFAAYLESLRTIGKIATPPTEVPLATALPMSHRPDTIAFMPRRLCLATGLSELNVPAFNFDWDVILATRQGRTLLPEEEHFAAIVENAWQKSQPSQRQ